MATPVVVATGSAETSSGTALTLPVTLSSAPESGDLCLVYAASAAGSVTFTATGSGSTGFTAVPEVSIGAAQSEQFLYRVCNGTETANITVTASGKHAMSVGAVLIRGANVTVSNGFDPAVPVNSGAAVTTASEVINVPNIVTSDSGDLLVLLANLDLPNGTSGADTVAPPPGFTTQINGAYGTGGTGSNTCVYIATGSQAHAGLTSTVSAMDSTAARQFCGLLVAVAGIPSFTSQLRFQATGISRWAVVSSPGAWLFQATERWSIISMAFPSISAQSVEEIAVQVSVTLGITNPSPTGTNDAVAMAFTQAYSDQASPPPAPAPNSSSWVSGSWVPNVSTSPFTALCLVGPGTSQVLTAGNWNVFVKITDNPEAPIRYVGLLTVY